METDRPKRERDRERERGKGREIEKLIVFAISQGSQKLCISPHGINTCFF